MGNDDYTATNKITGGTWPATAWQKFMAYAHTNIEVKQVAGIDVKPAPFVVKQAAADTTAAPVQAERPPTLSPQAALKLLDLADMLDATIKTSKPAPDQALLTVTKPVASN
jgi:penicillin-binding protein 1A